MCTLPRETVKLCVDRRQTFLRWIYWSPSSQNSRYRRPFKNVFITRETSMAWMNWKQQQIRFWCNPDQDMSIRLLT